MKKIFTLLIGIGLSFTILNAQEPIPGSPPQGFSYKATIVRSTGAVVASKPVGIQIRIYNVPSGADLYEYTETFTPTTNEYGQIDIIIGRKAGFSILDWSKGPYYLEVKVDVKGGTNYQLMSTTQLLSVPYALFAGTAGSASGAVTITGDQTITGIKTFNKDLSINGLTVGVGKGTGPHETAIGYQSLYSNTIGNDNTAIGYEALNKNTWGNCNIAAGYQALYENTGGHDNIAIGVVALGKNTTGFYNTAVGSGALHLNTLGQFNTATGHGALNLNETGKNNVAIGGYAGFSNKIGNNNIFIGSYAGRYETGSNRLFIDNLDRDYGSVLSNVALIYGEFDPDPVKQILAINGTLRMQNRNITNLANPVNAQDAATKAYVDALLQRISELEGNTAAITDADGIVYNTVKIGSQIWMKENLKTTKYRNGDDIGTTVPADLDITQETAPKYQWSWMGYQSYANTYGRLYTWYAVTDSRGLCPTGWHVPSNLDWRVLLTYLGTDYLGYLSGTYFMSNRAAPILKDASGMYWNDYDPQPTDEIGFTALPGGYRSHDGTFLEMGSFGCWWVSNKESTHYEMKFEATPVYIGPYFGPDYGYSVRCIKD